MKIENVYKSQHRPVEDDLIRKEDQRVFDKRFRLFFRKLNATQRLILTLCMHGLSNGQVLADDRGVTRSSISEIKGAILNKWNQTGGVSMNNQLK